MPRHDYDLPGDWNTKSDQEKNEWYTMERCRRQARRQQDAGSMGTLSRIDEIFSAWRDRVKRIREANSSFNFK